MERHAEPCWQQYWVFHVKECEHFMGKVCAINKNTRFLHHYYNIFLCLAVLCLLLYPFVRLQLSYVKSNSKYVALKVWFIQGWILIHVEIEFSIDCHLLSIHCIFYEFLSDWRAIESCWDAYWYNDGTFPNISTKISRKIWGTWKACKRYSKSHYCFKYLYVWCFCCSY